MFTNGGEDLFGYNNSDGFLWMLISSNVIFLSLQKKNTQQQHNRKQSELVHVLAYCTVRYNSNLKGLS